jgi:NAD(P)-dependent dehydrogenase (short-subunit alcohol dehydrogenase family)
VIDFRGQVTIVSGGGRGLGRAYALELGSRGAAVVVNDAGCDVAGTGSSPAPADEVVAEIIMAGGSAVASYESVATAQGGEAIVQTALSQFGRVDAVVSNAGIFGTVPFQDLTPQDWRQMLSVHLDGGFYLSQPAYRVMKQQQYGRFVFISSSAGMFGMEQEAHYAAAKTGLVGLMNVIAIEGAEHGILANAIQPTALTRMAASTSIPGAPAAADNPLFRIATADLVVPLVVYLASRTCEFSHRNYSAAAGRYARVSVALADGWLADGSEVPTADDIAAHMNVISATEPYYLPENIVDEVMEVFRRRNVL